MDLPQRKPNRLPDYNYSTPGAYFVTICTQDRKCILGRVAGTNPAHPPMVELSEYGRIVANAIYEIPKHYPAITIDNFVVMPNHIHLLLQIRTDDSGRAMLAPAISRVVQQLKGAVTKQIGHSIWQKLFHDHVVRGTEDYLKIWHYIADNPSKWEEDCFYVALKNQER